MASQESRGVSKAIVGINNQCSTWERAGATLDKIVIYPLKSGMGQEVETATALTHGLAVLTDDGEVLMRDREFIVAEGGGGDAELGPMVTGRRHPAMVLIETRLTRRDGGGGRLARFSAPGMEDLQVSLDEGSASRCRTVSLHVWSGRCSGLDLGQAAADWLREYLFGAESGRGVRLVWHRQGTSSRSQHPQQKQQAMDEDPGLLPGDVPLFGDATPYLVLSQESVSRIDDAVSQRNPHRAPADALDFRRFRPNLVLSGVGGAFAEDGFAFLRVGQDRVGGGGKAAVLRSCKLCSRCEFITVDPEVGQKQRGGEPLKTLRGFRCATDKFEKTVVGNRPMVGMGMALQQQGSLRVGDDVAYQLRA